MSSARRPASRPTRVGARSTLPWKRLAFAAFVIPGSTGASGWSGSPILEPLGGAVVSRDPGASIDPLSFGFSPFVRVRNRREEEAAGQVDGLRAAFRS